MPGTGECATEEETLVFVARKMRDRDIGALPICGADDKLQGMLTDRDPAEAWVIPRRGEAVHGGRQPGWPTDRRPNGTWSALTSAHAR